MAQIFSALPFLPRADGVLVHFAIMFEACSSSP